MTTPAMVSIKNMTSDNSTFSRFDVQIGNPLSAVFSAFEAQHRLADTKFFKFKSCAEALKRDGTNVTFDEIAKCCQTEPVSSSEIVHENVYFLAVGSEYSTAHASSSCLRASV